MSNAKLPIPRLTGGNPPPHRPKDQPKRSETKEKERQRISHACEPCRRRKAKCDGLQPSCTRCTDTSIPCYYADSKRQRQQRNSQLQADRATLYEQVLREILPLQDHNRQEMIRTALIKGRSNSERQSLTMSSGVEGDEYEESDDSHSSGESDDEGSHNLVLRSLRSSEQPQSRSPSFARTGGFLGKASMVRMLEEVGETLMSQVQPESQQAAMTLLQLVELPDQAAATDPATHKRELQRIVLEEATYYTTDMEHVSLENFGADVNPFDMPPREQADAFLDGFFSTLYPLFPIVFEPVFRSQHSEFHRTGVPPSPGIPLQAMFNLIYALGALHAELIASSAWNGEKDSHVTFFVRAMLLSFEPLNTLELPELHHTQLAGLFGMYFLASNQLNRGWLMIGRAVRFAQNRGFHLINDSPGSINPKTELEVRTWHSISSAERLACFLTGKPIACNGGSAATRPPHFIAERLALESFEIPYASEAPPSLLDSPETLEAFCKAIELDEILSATLAELYAPNVVLKSWASIQKLISKLNAQVANWRSSISQGLLIHDGPESERKAPIIQRVYLALRYFSTIITINRPSFCDGRHRKSIRSQSSSTLETDLHNAKRCVSAARDMVRMFVSKPDAVELYRASPWWCILHFLVQATTIIVMEISCNAAHLPDQMDDLQAEARKAISCLQIMGSKSAAAQRAANTCSRLFNLTALRNYPMRPAEELSSETASSNDRTASSTATAMDVAKSPAHLTTTALNSLETSFAFPISSIYRTASPPDESARHRARLVAPHPVYSPTMIWTPPPPPSISSLEDPLGQSFVPSLDASTEPTSSIRISVAQSPVEESSPSHRSAIESPITESTSKIVPTVTPGGDEPGSSAPSSARRNLPRRGRKERRKR